MANRVLRDFTDSEKINILSADAERFFTRLLMKADDFGFFHASLPLLIAALFPLKIESGSVTIPDVDKWLKECKAAGLIRVYSVKGKPYLKVENFGQRLRIMISKFPPPPDDPESDLADNPPTNDSGPPLESGIQNPESRIRNPERKPETGKEKGAILIFPFDTDSFKASWELWKKFKKEQFKFTYRGTISEQAALKKLSELAHGSEEIAVKIIMQSIDSGWRGLFILKNNGTNQSSGKKEFDRSKVEAGILRNFANK